LLFDKPSGALSNLSKFDADPVWGFRSDFLGKVPYAPSSQPYYAIQAALAAEREPTGGNIIKTWSELYLLRPWVGSGPLELVFSWTAPIAFCGNYSCFEGVVAADTSLSLVSRELTRTREELHDLLLQKPWDFEIHDNRSAVFVVNQVSPHFPDQEGLLVGAADAHWPGRPGEMVQAVNASSDIIAAASRAVLLRFGSWGAPALRSRTQHEVFQFRLSAALRGKMVSCEPLRSALEGQGDDPDCFLVATHSMFLDDSLQWLSVVVLPAAAFSSFYATTVKEVFEEVAEEQSWAAERSKKAIAFCISMGIAITFLGLCLGLIVSCLVLRPLARLSLLMRRLSKLDFSHDSFEFKKIHQVGVGRVREMTELQEGFCRLSRSIEVFARFVPETVVKGLVRGDASASRLHVSKRNVTIMFSDIRDFTSISETVKQNDLLFMLTLYLTVMTGVVESTEGVVGEVLGDGLLAFWNTPDNVENHAAKACAAALEQQRALGPLNAELLRLRLPQLAIRIGLHTGDVLTGNIGSEMKMKFGCMGDPVNLASRLEGLCKTYGITTMCSEATRRALPDSEGFIFRKLDLVQVKGKKEATTIYELIGRDQVLSSAGGLVEGGESAVVPAARRQQAQLYEEALQAYHVAQFAEAARLAEALRKQRPEDIAAARLHDRARGFAEALRQGKAAAPSKEELARWTGVVMMTDK